MREFVDRRVSAWIARDARTCYHGQELEKLGEKSLLDFRLNAMNSQGSRVIKCVCTVWSRDIRGLELSF